LGKKSGEPTTARTNSVPRLWGRAEATARNTARRREERREDEVVMVPASCVGTL
jgi:hypothetical protein